MKNIFSLLTRCLAIGLILLSSCAKIGEQPVPNLPSKQTSQLDPQQLRQLFLDKKYDQQLIFSSKDGIIRHWTPRWEKAYQQAISDSTTYVYVPLEAPSVEWIGVKKYLFIKSTGGKLAFSEATYTFRSKENIAWAPTNAHAFFASFTGALLLKNMASGAASYLIYKSGIRQTAQLKKANGPSTTPNASTAGTTGCYLVFTCYWTGHCSLSGSSNGGATYGDVTTGINNCDYPAEDGVGCSQISWTSDGTTSNEVCDGNPGDPGNPGGGVGVGGGGSDPTVALEATLDGSNSIALFPPCPGLTDAWIPLINFKASAPVINRLNDLTAQQLQALGMLDPFASVDPKWQIQAIQNAGGLAVNLDNFSVIMTQLPTINGVEQTPSQFLEYIRTHINDFMGPGFGQPTFTPSPNLPGENAKWQNHELGTIVSIDLPADDGSVILSDYSQTDWNVHWTFSTLDDPFNGSHPVSGTREFGITTYPSGSFTWDGRTSTWPETYNFYIQGADRILSRPGEYVGSILNLSTNPSRALQYGIADGVWNGAIGQVAKFVNDASRGGHPGSAIINTPLTNRPLWAGIADALQNHRPLNSVPCD